MVKKAQHPLRFLSVWCLVSSVSTGVTGCQLLNLIRCTNGDVGAFETLLTPGGAVHLQV